MERLLTVEFGPSRSKRFGRAVAEAESGAGDCSEVEPGRYRVRFVLGEDAAAYTGLARLLERVRHWRATEVYWDGELVSAFTPKRWPSVPPSSSRRSGPAASTSATGSCPAARSAPCSTPNERSGTSWARTRRGTSSRSPSAPSFAPCSPGNSRPASTKTSMSQTSHQNTGERPRVTNRQAETPSRGAKKAAPHNGDGLLGARRVLDAAERPVGSEPLTHGTPERGIELRVARPYPGECTGVVVAVGQRVDVDAPDHVAARWIEHRVREPRAVAEVVGVSQQVCPVLVRRHRSRPLAVLPTGCRVDVMHRRGPRVVVLVVVLGAERLEHELRRLEPPRDVEVARDELVHATDGRTLAQVEPGESIVTCTSVLKVRLTKVQTRAASCSVAAPQSESSRTRRYRS